MKRVVAILLLFSIQAHSKIEIFFEGWSSNWDVTAIELKGTKSLELMYAQSTEANILCNPTGQNADKCVSLSISSDHADLSQFNLGDVELVGELPGLLNDYTTKKNDESLTIFTLNALLTGLLADESKKIAVFIHSPTGSQRKKIIIGTRTKVGEYLEDRKAQKAKSHKHRSWK